MRFNTLALVACATLGAAMADVSHLMQHYVPPSMMMSATSATAKPNIGLSMQQMGERVVTTIEKLELRELPTQTEYLQAGQMAYGFGVPSAKSHHNLNGMVSGNMPLEMMMPKELLSPPPLKQEEQQTITPTNHYLAPMEPGEPATESEQKSMPMRQYLASMMQLSEQEEQMGSTSAHSSQHIASEMNDYDQQDTQQEPTALLPQVHASRVPSLAITTNKLTAPSTMPSDAQHVQQQSAPAARYLPPLQQIPQMPTSQYLPPQGQGYQMQMQAQQQIQMQPAQKFHAPLASNYLLPALKMSAPLMNVTPQMQPHSRSYLSPFGEVENVAEAAQEAAQMFDEQLAQQPMPPPTAVEAEPVNFYLPPSPSGAEHQLEHQQHHTIQSKQMAPVEFVRQQEQQMGRGNGGETTAIFNEFKTRNTLQMQPATMPAHLLANDGYYYGNGRNDNELVRH